MLLEIGKEQAEILKNRIEYEERRKDLQILSQEYEVRALTCEKEFNVQTNQHIAHTFYIYKTPDICEDECGFILDHCIFRTLPKRKCLHETCEDGDTEYGYCEHPICKSFLDRKGNSCGSHKHDLIYQILENSRSKQTCEGLFFSENTRSVVAEIVTILEDKVNGVDVQEIMDFITELCLQPQELQDVIMMLSTKIIIDSLNSISYLKYNRDLHKHVDKSSPAEVEEYLRYLCESS